MKSFKSSAKWADIPINREKQQSNRIMLTFGKVILNLIINGHNTVHFKWIFALKYFALGYANTSTGMSGVYRGKMSYRQFLFLISCIANFPPDFALPSDDYLHFLGIYSKYSSVGSWTNFICYSNGKSFSRRF